MRFFPANMDYQKKYFPSSLPSSKLTISDLISIYKHDAIDIADPNSMQDACHINFVIDLAHLGVSVAQWLGHWGWNWKVWGSIPHGINPKQFFLCPMLVTRRKKTYLSLWIIMFSKTLGKSLERIDNYWKRLEEFFQFKLLLKIGNTARYVS